MPRRDRRRQAQELRALAEAHDASALFPSIRPRDPVLEAYAEQVAAALDPSDPRVPIDAVERGVALVDERERRRIVDDWASAHPQSWASLSGVAGDVQLVERAFVASAVRGSISERRPVARSALVPLEDGALGRSPVAALGLVLPPPLVWDRTDAIAIAGVLGKQRNVDEVRFDSILARARERTTDEHVDRLRVVADRLAKELPVHEMPVASATAAAGCAQIASDDAVAAELAALLLVTYAASLAQR